MNRATARVKTSAAERDETRKNEQYAQELKENELENSVVIGGAMARFPESTTWALVTMTHTLAAQRLLEVQTLEVKAVGGVATLTISPFDMEQAEHATGAMKATLEQHVYAGEAAHVGHSRENRALAELLLPLERDGLVENLYEYLRCKALDPKVAEHKRRAQKMHLDKPAKEPAEWVRPAAESRKKESKKKSLLCRVREKEEPTAPARGGKARREGQTLDTRTPHGVVAQRGRSGRLHTRSVIFAELTLDILPSSLVRLTFARSFPPESLLGNIVTVAGPMGKRRPFMSRCRPPR